jgi:hypothetical protein
MYLLAVRLLPNWSEDRGNDGQSRTGRKSTIASSDRPRSCARVAVRWTPFRASPLSIRRASGSEFGVERLMDRCVERPSGPPPDARAVVRSFGTEQVRSPFDRSSGRLASKACGRAVARGIRAIGSAMRVVKVRDRRGPEREPAPALDAADAAGARVGKLREVAATGLYRGKHSGFWAGRQH